MMKPKENHQIIPIHVSLEHNTMLYQFQLALVGLGSTILIPLATEKKNGTDVASAEGDRRT